MSTQFYMHLSDTDCETVSLGLTHGQSLRAMAATYQTGLTQIVFRFAMQIGMLPLTGTTNPEHMKEDLAADQFTLTAEELRRIETIGL